ncbi:hypothetical protein [Aeromonas dhakensis]|uniref:hypothetical protein n=1 Tax=Aeromonas dhakensis TaxID=196024 RepID=UPI002D78A1BD|nr:hypothetical protein [Aeromonas dhakensis]WRT72178.1 hypothetical protein VK677_17855 [Aeromonas dhakensis]
MHHAIEHQHFFTPHLQVGVRKRVPAGQLLRIARGAALLRLGAHELLLTAGNHFWLCADALAAFSPLAGCRYDLLTCSVRVDQPAQAGWLQPGPLLDPLFDSLADWQRPRDWHGAYGHRLQVLLDELQGCPIQPQADVALQTAWQGLAAGLADGNEAWQQARAQWQLLQAVRLLKSGSKAPQVASKLGYEDERALDRASQQWLGCPLATLLAV